MPGKRLGRAARGIGRRVDLRTLKLLSDGHELNEDGKSEGFRVLSSGSGETKGLLASQAAARKRELQKT